MEKDYEVEINGLKEAVKMLREQIKELFEKINVLNNFQSSAGEQFKNINEKLTDLKEQMKELICSIKTIQDKPAKRWETLITALITGIAGMAVMYFLKK